MKRAENLSALCRAYGVEILYVFGSRSREAFDWLAQEGDALSPGPSDVDVGVKPGQGVKLDVHQKVKLAVELEDFFGVWRVDLVSLHDADPFQAANIIRGERLYAQSQDQADEYDLYILRRAGDLIHLERERIALILGEDKCPRAKYHRALSPIMLSGLSE